MLHRFQTARLAAVAVILGSLVAVPAFAADATSSSTTTTSTSAKHGMHHESLEEMKEHVENRINTLHAKLGITADQEDDWSKVADAMRTNESDIGALIHARHNATQPMTAVEDMESYQKIAQAHADGLAKVASAFSPLYDKMTDEQKANADKVFGGFEGHRGAHKHHPMKGSVKTKSTTTTTTQPAAQ